LEGGPERQVESAQPAARHGGVDTQQGQADGVAERSAASGELIRYPGKLARNRFNLGRGGAGPRQGAQAIVHRPHERVVVKRGAIAASNDPPEAREDDRAARQPPKRLDFDGRVDSGHPSQSVASVAARASPFTCVR